jgi:hypothetical protein
VKDRYGDVLTGAVSAALGSVRRASDADRQGRPNSDLYPRDEFGSR